VVEQRIGAGLPWSVNDPINIRYATGTSNMQVEVLHDACRYAFVATVRLQGLRESFEALSGGRCAGMEAVRAPGISEIALWVHRKLEEQILVTAHGPQPRNRPPFHRS
jgi:hypothetical protein